MALTGKTELHHVSIGHTGPILGGLGGSWGPWEHSQISLKNLVGAYAHIWLSKLHRITCLDMRDLCPCLFYTHDPGRWLFICCCWTYKYWNATIISLSVHLSNFIIFRLKINQSHKLQWLFSYFCARSGHKQLDYLKCNHLWEATCKMIITMQALWNLG
jgi:hypothetical protein